MIKSGKHIQYKVKEHVIMLTVCLQIQAPFSKLFNTQGTMTHLTPLRVIFHKIYSIIKAILAKPAFLILQEHA